MIADERGKLIFRYGVMGSSKTAQALMLKYAYEEKGYKVLLLKPSVDTRDGVTTVKSRVGIASEASVISSHDDTFVMWTLSGADIVVVDEAQFLSCDQVNQLRLIACSGATVICYGLKTNFMTKLFEGSKRLLEISDSIEEIASPCKCGRNAIINARIDEQGHIVEEGDEIEIGGDDRYTAMCYECYLTAD